MSGNLFLPASLCPLPPRWRGNGGERQDGAAAARCEEAGGCDTHRRATPDPPDFLVSCASDGLSMGVFFSFGGVSGAKRGGRGAGAADATLERLGLRFSFEGFR